MQQITLPQARVLAYLHSWGHKYQGNAFEIKVRWISQDLGYANRRSIYLLLPRLIDAGAITWFRGNRADDPLVRVFKSERDFDIVLRQNTKSEARI